MNKQQLEKDFPEVFESVIADGRRQAINEMKEEGSTYVPRKELDSKVEELSTTKIELEDLQSQVEESKSLCEEKEAQILALEEKNKDLVAAKDALESQVEESKKAADKAAAEAYLSENLATHPHREHLLGRITDDEKANLESAKAALTRETEYLISLGIPTAPINVEELKRTGRGPSHNEDTEPTENQESDAVYRMNRRAGY